MAVEISTVADDLAVLHDGTKVHSFDSLEPDTEYEFLGVRLRTLARPPGELLSRIATVNDVHFGETECGVIEGLGGPVLTADQGAPPYAEVMNAAAVAEITAIEPAAVVVKGDLTRDGEADEYAAFLACYSGAFGDTLTHVRGNHDAYRGQDYAAGHRVVDVAGARLVVLDTVIPEHTTGRFDRATSEWVEDFAATADRPVLLFGHHHPWPPSSAHRDPNYFGLDPDSSERLVDLIARLPRIIGYFAGHTHRNRVRRFAPTGQVPYVEVACVKDFPGSWAEYRVYEGGVLQVHHRISTPEALRWSERCRILYSDLGLDYTTYALGKTLEDRCLAIWPR